MATDFFERQDAARRKTAVLVLYFALTVVLIIAIVYALVVAGLYASQESSARRKTPVAAFWNPDLLVFVSGGTLFVIAMGSIFKWIELSGGGTTIATMLGGRLINPQTTDLAEKKLLNVVEEMSIASGTPVPPVYVMDHEASINAFAAGYKPGDAVIGMARGSLDYLTRDELQGVVAHEFSHILNGDMRLNIRLIGLLNGILLIAIIGYYMIRATASSGRSSRGKGKEAGALFMAGLALMTIGYIGVFFASLIKSAVSRQREYLADASAVQFTRNPDGIAGALKKIGGLAYGSRIQNAAAAETSHMFFGKAVSQFLDVWFSTHPPLGDRIARLDPAFDGAYPPVERVADRIEPAASQASEERKHDASERIARRAPLRRRTAAGVAVVPLAVAEAIDDIGNPGAEHVAYAAAIVASLPDALAQACHEPFTARAVVFALLIDVDDEIRRRQLDLLDSHAERGTSDDVRRLLTLVSEIGEEARLPLVEMTTPALRQLSSNQFAAFRDMLNRLVKADEQVSVFEYALVRLLLRHLDRQFGQTRPKAVKHHKLERIKEPVEILLSTLAHAGHDEAQAKSAFAAGAAKLGPSAASISLRPTNQCGVTTLDGALEPLTLAAPALRRALLEASAACVVADGQVAITELELLRAVADAFDFPMPPLLAKK